MPQRRRSKSRRSLSWRHTPKQAFGLMAVAASAVLGLALTAATTWPPYAAWLIAASGVTFALYGFDKARSKGPGTRVPEIVLHGLALAGGVAGGWAGRALFRHKTRKPAFALVLALATAIHAAIGYAVFLGQ